MKKFLVFGDIHGRFDRLDQAITKFKDLSSDYTFVFLGDYIDRGKESKEVLELLIDLNKNRPETLFLMGNHEEFLMGFCDNNYLHKDSIFKNESKINLYNIWLRNGGNETIKSLKIDSNNFKIDKISHFIEFIDNNCNYIYLHKNLIFVHAGIDRYKPLDQNTIEDFLWIRPPFGTEYQMNQLIIHGHTSKQTVIRNYTENSINIDTRAYADDGCLSVLEISEDGKNQLIRTFN